MNVLRLQCQKFRRPQPSAMLNQHSRSNSLSSLRSMPCRKQKAAFQSERYSVFHRLATSSSSQSFSTSHQFALYIGQKELSTCHQGDMLRPGELSFCAIFHHQKIQVLGWGQHQIILLLQVVSECLKTFLVFEQRILTNTLPEIRVQSPHATAHLCKTHHNKRDNLSAGCRADSTHGRKTRSLAAKHVAAFILKTRFKGKEGDLPFVIEQAVGMLSCRLNSATPWSPGHEETRLNILSTVRDSPMVMWSLYFHLPCSTSIQRSSLKRWWESSVKGTVGTNALSGNFAPWRPSSRAIDLPTASPCLSRSSTSS